MQQLQFFADRPFQARQVKLLEEMLPFSVKLTSLLSGPHAFYQTSLTFLVRPLLVVWPLQL